MKKNGAAAVRRRLRQGWGPRYCKPCAVNQNKSFNPNCICLPGLADCANPNVGPPIDAFGAENIGVFEKLMNCVMNCRLKRSVKWKFLVMLISAVERPGPRNEPTPQFPNVCVAGNVTDAGFRNCTPMFPDIFTKAPLPC
jgi:hypothetical protein